MKKLTLVCCALLLSLSLYAQENFLPGYIITNSKDTTRGYIDYRNWKTNPGTISFKQEINSVIFFYTPTHIAAFSVADEFYESATVNIEVSPTGLNDLTYEYEFKIEQQTAFLQC